ncbi:Alpha/Beta hydrolase protein [Podospora australis]|uniref:Alpha/Beta hydrolase protein n=1 Tax=Podospora australis TaxID=1536484 RepID=A0AAN7AJ23_9PEZI|nr:Alpha/Beta hydrolase protein [Podospora australis]
MGRPEIPTTTAPARRLPQPQARRTSGVRRGWVISGIVISGLVLIAVFPQLRFMNGSSASSVTSVPQQYTQHSTSNPVSVYGQFPQPDDPFQFLPCTPRTVPPLLDDGDAKRSWAGLFDPNPDHWSWGAPPKSIETARQTDDGYAGRGIFLCGYLDVPLDYTNKSGSRIARLAVTKFQVSGLALSADTNTSAGKKSERTIIIEPGGPGGSGTSYAWRAAEATTERLSKSKYDVLGWDPRGVNISRPAIACFPHDANRDHWNLLTNQHRAVVASPRDQVEIADVMNAAVMRACWEMHGDLGRFVSTAFVARDLDQIRAALGEDEVSGNFVSYGTGIAQTYASMFPDRVGRMILDGTEYVRDHRLRGGFGWTALDNATDAWHDGFLGECVNAGPEFCALAKPKDGKAVMLADLESRMEALFKSLASRPVPAYLPSSGPTMVTYSALVDGTYGAMYNANSWPTLAETLYDLESGNATLAALLLEGSLWHFDPEAPCPTTPKPPLSEELGSLVICADSYDATEPDDLDWWLSLWGNMTTQNWIAGNSRFYDVLGCRHFNTYWKPAEVYRGDLNHTLKHPVLLIAETYDPATPLRNGRRLLHEMGSNARLIAHHGYGHSSRDTSKCTDSLARAYILHGTLPEEAETACYADEKPYRYGAKTNGFATSAKSMRTEDHVKAWREHLKELSLFNPRLLPGL